MEKTKITSISIRNNKINLPRPVYIINNEYDNAINCLIEVIKQWTIDYNKLNEVQNNE